MTRLQKDKGSPWIQVRIRRSTHATLREWGRKWHEMGLVDLAVQGGGEREEPAIDGIIQELLRRDEEHRARGRKSRANKALKEVDDLLGQAERGIAKLEGNEYIADGRDAINDRSGDVPL